MRITPFGLLLSLIQLPFAGQIGRHISLAILEYKNSF